MTQAPPSLRILFHHRIAASDGMRVHINELVGALRGNGHVVKVVGPPSADEEPRAGGASNRLERITEHLRKWLPPAAYEVLELLYNLPAYLRLDAAAKAFGPDVVYERYNLFLLAGLLFRRRSGTPMLLEINSPLATERAAFGDLRLKHLGKRCEAALWRGADVALPVTHVLASEVRAARGAGAVQVIPNGAHLGHRPDPSAVAEIRRGLGLDDRALVLGFVGFVRAWHGAGWAIEALRDLPREAHLVIVGDGPARSDLQARAESLGVADRVHLVGRVSHERVPAYMACFDVALQTAAVPYASPLKLFEYMALGLAVVAPDQPNIREVLRDGDNAILFAPDDRHAFAAALKRLCGDIALRSRIGAAALRTIEETPFTWSHNALRIEALARGLLQAKVAGAARHTVPIKLAESN